MKEKGWLSHSQGESALTLALTGFYCFSGHITLRMVLIYTKERMLLITFKKGRIFANVNGKVVELVTLILGRFTIDFRKLL